MTKLTTTAIAAALSALACKGNSGDSAPKPAAASPPAAAPPPAAPAGSRRIALDDIPEPKQTYFGGRVLPSPKTNATIEIPAGAVVAREDESSKYDHDAPTIPSISTSSWDLTIDVLGPRTLSGEIDRYVPSGFTVLHQEQLDRGSWILTVGDAKGPLETVYFDGPLGLYCHAFVHGAPPDVPLAVCRTLAKRD